MGKPCHTCESKMLPEGQCPTCGFDSGVARTLFAPLESVEARYRDLLQRLGVMGHDGAVAEIEALRRQSAIGTTYRQVGWAQIELRATQGGMLYEVAGSVSEERTEHHTEPVYIAVVEAADRHTLENVPSTKSTNG